MVVTMEPCAMCAGAIVHARLDGVVYGCRDALAGAVVSRSDLLDASFLNHRVWHMGGVLSGECAALIRTFFAKRR
jgi:tRNA(adenine34) deaminase